MFLDKSAKYINADIKRDTIPMERFDRKRFSNKLGINSFTIKPTTEIGIVPIRTELNNFFKINLLLELIKLLSKNFKIFFLKYQNNAKILPI